MMTIKLYADENFPQSVVIALRHKGYEVLTAYEAGQANRQVPDQEVLAYAISQQRAVLTQNRKDFIRLHQTVPNHTGIIVCREDPQHSAQLAQRIHLQLMAQAPLDNKLV
jgi:predicted nuclease of predicted toxin-antitoxin system